MSVYNGEKYLAQAVDSVLSQTFKDFEFIIIDDCSIDRTSEILQDYHKQDSRIKLIRKNENKGFKGFVENLNIGLREAKGIYIARMDADDICVKDRLEKQVKFLDENPETFLVGSSMYLIDENGTQTKILRAIPDFENIKKRTRIDNPMFHPAIMFRNIEGLFYRDKMYACEDFDFHLRNITENRKLENISEPLLYYRILEKSISRAGNTFVKRIFLEKAKSFYKERMQTGKDAYEIFDDEHFLQILNPDFHNSKEELKFAAEVAILYSFTKELKLISKKLKKQYNYKSFYFEINGNEKISKVISYIKLKIR